MDILTYRKPWCCKQQKILQKNCKGNMKNFYNLIPTDREVDFLRSLWLGDMDAAKRKSFEVCLKGFTGNTRIHL